MERVSIVSESELLGSGHVHIRESVQSSLPLGTTLSAAVSSFLEKRIKLRDSTRGIPLCQ